MMKHASPITCLAALLLAGSLNAANPKVKDWPRWRGPDVSGRSQETGLLQAWPDGGPKRVWLYENAGLGYSSFAVSMGHVYTLGARDSAEFLIAINEKTGREAWAVKIGDLLTNNWGDGPRATPTVDGNVVYAMSGQGNVVCADTTNGKILWTASMAEYGGKRPNWGYTESVLVDGNQLVCTPGGRKGTVLALDKMTGKKIWQSTDWTEDAQYASIVPVNLNGTRQYIQLTMKTFGAVDARTGDLLWKADWPVGRTAVIPTPIYKDGKVYITSGYGAGCTQVKVGPGNKVEEVYKNKVMKNHHGGVILVGDHLYGYSDRMGWTCQNFNTGEEVWAEGQALGKGCLTYADGRLVCVDEGNGDVALIEASPKGWKEHGRFRLEPQSPNRSPKGKVWTHPVVANGRLYLRDQENVMAYDIKAN